MTVKYVQHNLYYMIGFQCICISPALLGYNLLLIISLLHIIIHLPFFIISIVTYITIINKNFYKEKPLLFLLYSCACLLLFLLLMFLLVKLYGLISHLIDYYFLQTKSTDGNNAGSPVLVQNLVQDLVQDLMVVGKDLLIFTLLQVKIKVSKRRKTQNLSISLM